MQRTRVAVLRGGLGSEYELSLQTGEHVMRAIDTKRYEVLDVVITKAGEWLLRGKVRAPKEILHQVELVFVALHNMCGENGPIQRILDDCGVRYTGSQAFAHGVANHKAMAKNSLLSHGVRMPQHMIVARDVLPNISGAAASVGMLFGPRYVIKAITGGSSVGTMYAEGTLMLEQALRTALSVYPEVLVEEFIEGKEATCGVIEDFRDQKSYALPPVEVVHTAPIFNYSQKYHLELEHRCPSCFLREEKQEIERLAKLAHEVIGASHYSRSDFIVARDGIYFLEINTLPDLRETSLMAKALAVVGSNYVELIAHLLTLAAKNKRSV